MVVRCPVGISASGLVLEVRVCGNDSVGIGKAMLWQVRCNMLRSKSNGKDIMIVRCPVRCLGIVRHDRSCMLEQWATIHLPVAFIADCPQAAIPTTQKFCLKKCRGVRASRIMRMPSVEAMRDAERCDAGVRKRVGPSFFCFCQHTGVRRLPHPQLLILKCYTRLPVSSAPMPRRFFGKSLPLGKPKVKRR